MPIRYRFALLVCSLITLVYGGHAVWIWLSGNSTLSMAQYWQHVFSLTSAVVAGYGFTCLALWHLSRQKAERLSVLRVLKNVEPTIKKRYWQPTLLPVSQAPELHPLESELLAYWQRFNHWPLNVAEGKAYTQPALGNSIVNHWSQHLHLSEAVRIAILAEHLSLTITNHEKIVVLPWWQIWQRQQIELVSIAQANSAHSLICLTHFKGWYNMPETDPVRQQLPLLIRYANHVADLPTNAPPGSANTLKEFVQHRFYIASANTEAETVSQVDFIENQLGGNA